MSAIQFPGNAPPPFSLFTLHQRKSRSARAWVSEFTQRQLLRLGQECLKPIHFCLAEMLPRLLASMLKSNVESDDAEFDHWAGARHMLIRMRFLRACQVFLLCGLLLAAGQVIRAQSVGTAPSPVPVASPTQPPQSASPQTPPKPVLNFTEVVLLAEKQGGSTSIRNYIAEDLGLKPTSVDSPPVHARGLEYSDQRKLYVIDETGALLFMISNGDNTDVYLASHAGVLQSAGYFYPGRFHSQGFKRVSKEKAAAGFVAEKEFWIKKISDPKYGGAVKLEEPVRKTDYARPEASA